MGTYLMFRSIWRWISFAITYLWQLPGLEDDRITRALVRYTIFFLCPFLILCFYHMYRDSGVPFPWEHP